MKRAILFIAMMGFSVALSAQSVAELARKERACRDALNGRHAVVVRNLDLLAVRKRPAVEISIPEEAEGGQVEGAGTAAGSEGSASETRESVSGVATEKPGMVMDEVPEEISASTVTMAQLEAAKERVDLLQTKMNALRRQFESQDAMVPGYVIQQQMEETNLRLLKAQAQQARIEAQISRSPAAKKAPAETER
jgi:hypothetical protein